MTALRAAARVCSRSTPLSRRYLSQQALSFANSKFFRVSEEVRDALATGKPVVALETTIYTHGKNCASYTCV